MLLLVRRCGALWEQRVRVPEGVLDQHGVPVGDGFAVLFPKEQVPQQHVGLRHVDARSLGEDFDAADELHGLPPVGEPPLARNATRVSRLPLARPVWVHSRHRESRA